jgi:hypothetical protein
MDDVGAGWISLGTGVSYREVILGVLQHDAYHAGQTALLEKPNRGE